MYLRVQVEDSDLTYSLDRNEILIGSSPVCDLIVLHSSISKKHVKLVCENGKWYANDLGSTNGSFIQDQQMVPGKRVEFELKEKIRLGSKCSMTLVDQCEHPFPLPGPKELPVAKNTSTQNDEDKTQVISLKDLRFNDQKKPKVTSTRKAEAKKPQKTDSQHLRKVFIICLVIMGVGYLVNRTFLSNREEQKGTVAKKMLEKTKKQTEVLDRQ